MNFTTAARPLVLLAVVLGYGAVYYVLFRVVSRRFDLATPGRERDQTEVPGVDHDSRVADGAPRVTDVTAAPRSDREHTQENADAHRHARGLRRDARQGEA